MAHQYNLIYCVMFVVNRLFEIVQRLIFSAHRPFHHTPHFDCYPPLIAPRDLEGRQSWCTSPLPFKCHPIMTPIRHWLWIILNMTKANRQSNKLHHYIITISTVTHFEHKKITVIWLDEYTNQTLRLEKISCNWKHLLRFEKV